MPRRTQARVQKQYDWEAAFIAQSALASGTAVQFNMFTADAAETLVRTRGEVDVMLDVIGSAAGDACVVGVGLIVISAGAVLAISPVIDGNANWLWHGLTVLSSEYAVADGSNNMNTKRFTVDNKAMRKLREAEQIALVFENVNLNGVPGVVVDGALRVLSQR